MLVGAALFGGMLLLPLYYQIDRGLSPLDAGLLLAPQGIGAAVAMRWSGRLTDRIGGGPVVVAGLLTLIVGTLPFTQVTGSTSYALLAFSLVVRGVGLGFTMMPAMASAYALLETSQVPRATPMLNVAAAHRRLDRHRGARRRAPAPARRRGAGRRQRRARRRRGRRADAAAGCARAPGRPDRRRRSATPTGGRSRSSRSRSSPRSSCGASSAARAPAPSSGPASADAVERDHDAGARAARARRRRLAAQAASTIRQSSSTACTSLQALALRRATATSRTREGDRGHVRRHPGPAARAAAQEHVTRGVEVAADRRDAGLRGGDGRLVAQEVRRSSARCAP